jgi:hypothetical protein
MVRNREMLIVIGVESQIAARKVQVSDNPATSMGVAEEILWLKAKFHSIPQDTGSHIPVG